MAGPRRPGWMSSLPGIGQWPAFHLRASDYVDLIFVHGNGAELRRAVICPCIRIDTNLPNALCGICQGVGYAYADALREPTLVLDHSRSSSIRRQGIGALTEGRISVTLLPSDTPPAIGDLLLPDGDVVVVHERFHRDVRAVDARTLADRAMYRAGPGLTTRPRPAKLLYPTVTRVDAVAWIVGPPGGAQRLVLAEPGSDYRITDATIEWIADRGPKEAEGFSVRYHAPAAYLVDLSEPLFRHEADQPMPWSVEAQRVDKVQREADVR